MVRRERPEDEAATARVVASAFATGDGSAPVEVRLLEALRADAGWLPRLSLVAEQDDVVGHVVCTRGWVGDAAALGLGPLSVHPDVQGTGVGAALMHAVLAAADALDEPLVALLGHRGYYPRFGFVPAASLGVQPPVAAWGDSFQVRPLTAYRVSLRGEFRYAQPFRELD